MGSFHWDPNKTKSDIELDSELLEELRRENLKATLEMIILKNSKRKKPVSQNERLSPCSGERPRSLLPPYLDYEV